MGYGAILWILITLVAISFTGNYPIWALVIGAGEGLGLGIYFWREVSRRQTSSEYPVDRDNFLSRLCKYELFLQIPFLFILLLTNRLPVYLSFFALVSLLLLKINRKIATGSFLVLTPLTYPVLLLLIPSLISLYAAVDLRLSWNAVCMLIAGMALCLSLPHSLNSEPHLSKAFGLFLIACVGVAVSPFLIMQLPGAKVPLISSLYRHLPAWLPRTIHPNYIGGTLTFFFPAALGAFIGYKSRINQDGAAGRGPHLPFSHAPISRRGKGAGWSALPHLPFSHAPISRRGKGVGLVVLVVLVGLGLLMTQSRGALLGCGVAVVLMGAYGNRWVRYGLPILVVIAGLFIYSQGVEGLLDPAVGAGVERKLESRQELWERAVYISQDFAFTGIGLRSFPVVVDLLYPLFLIGPNARMPHPHNLYLEVVASTGFPGYVAFWTLLGAWGGMIWEVLRRCWENPNGRLLEWIGVGLAGGMAAHLVYSVTDAIALGEKAGVVFWSVLGLTGGLWRVVRRQGGGEKPTPKFAQPSIDG